MRAKLRDILPGRPSVFAFLVILLIIGSGKAQDNNRSKTTGYYYCELVRNPASVANGITIHIVFGDSSGFYNEEQQYKIDKRLEKLGTMVDAMNLMDKEGWEFVQAYLATESLNTFTTRWLLRRKRDK
jgi:hypothetical protein